MCIYCISTFLEALVCMVHMNAVTDKMLPAQNSADLDNLCKSWNTGADQLKMLANGLTKSANSLKTHVDKLKRNDERAKTIAQMAEEQAVVDVLKNQTKLSAKKVQEAEDSLPYLFSVDIKELTSLGLAQDIVVYDKAPPVNNLVTASEPCILRKSNLAEEWNADAKNPGGDGLLRFQIQHEIAIWHRWEGADDAIPQGGNGGD